MAGVSRALYFVSSITFLILLLLLLFFFFCRISHLLERNSALGNLTVNEPVYFGSHLSLLLTLINNSTLHVLLFDLANLKLPKRCVY